MSASADADADALMVQQHSDRSHSPSVNGKRKRNDENTAESPDLAGARGSDANGLVGGLLQILTSTYTFVSDILSHEITPSAGSQSPKRAKRSPSPSTELRKTTISAKIASEAYADVQDFLEDVDKALHSIAQGLAKSDISIESETPSTQHLRAFRKELHDLVGFKPQTAGKALALASKNSSSSTTTDQGTVESAAGPILPKGLQVLTLHGNGGRDGTKMWFVVPDSTYKSREGGIRDTFRSSALPSGVSISTIYPQTQPEGPKTLRTLADLLPATSHLPALKPPQPPPSLVTRSHVVEWYTPSFEPPKSWPVSTDTYADARLGKGEWLSYNSHADADESVSEKRLNRERALSGGQGPDESELEFLQQQRNARARVKKTSLFKSAFCSFGPSRDDSDATVSSHMRAQVWWNTAGEEIYDTLADREAAVPLSERIQALDQNSDDSEANIDEYVQVFQDAVDAFNADIDTMGAEEHLSSEESFLTSLSDMLEALWLYQQQRHQSVGANGQAGTRQPSQAEKDGYEAVKGQLAWIIGLLPPAAVARLDGTAMSGLNITTAVEISVKSTPGTIEEPKARVYDASTPAQGRPPAAQSATVGRLAYQQHPASTPLARPNPQPPRSAGATTSFTQYGNRPQVPAQYGYQSQTVQQPSRFSQHSQPHQARPSQLSNGYQQNTANGQQLGHDNANQTSSPAPRPPHPNQYTNRPPQSYQPRPSTYQASGSAQGAAADASSAATPGGSSYSQAGQNRNSYNLNQKTQPAVQNGQYSSGRPSSASGTSSNSPVGIPQGATGTIGALINLSPEEQIAMQKQRLQQAGSPTNQTQAPPQTPTVPRPPSSNGVVQTQSQVPQAPMQSTVNGA